jgi:hypothetical protein
MSLGKRLISVGGGGVCNTDSVQAFGADNAFSSNVALYQLDGNADDTTGDYNGTATNVTYSTGNFGQAAVFNGSSSKIDTGFAQNTNNAFSWSLWFKADTSSGINMLIDTTSNTNPYPGCGIGHSNGVLAGFIAGTTSNLTYSGETISLNQWHHTVLTYNGSGSFKLYLDSVEVGSGTHSTNVNSGQNILIGNSVVSTWPGHNGSIDEVRIFDKAISAEDVATLYAETTSTASNTNTLGEGSGVALYTLDYDASDAGGLYDGTPTDVEFGVGGQINYGARFNGSSSNIQINTFSGFTNYNFTLSTWIKTTDTLAYIISFRDPIYMSLIMGGYSGGTNGMGIYDGSNQYFINNTAMQGINDGDWHHIVMTHDGTNLKGYIDGSLTETVSTGTTTQFSGGANYNRIGVRADGNTAAAYDGDIDQVRLFSKSLSQSEIDALYAETACVYTCTTDTVDFPTTNVAYYKLDNSAEDEKGNDGTINGTVDFNFGRFGQSAKIGGTSSDYINLGTISELPTNTQNTVDFSWSGWVKATNAELNATSGSNFFFNHSKNSYQLIGFGGNVSGNFPTGRISYYTFGGSSYHNSWIQSSSTYSDGNWHHVVVTDEYNSGTDNRTRTLYVDNVQVAQDTVDKQFNNSASLTTISTGDINAYGGHIEQVRIFSTALDSDQISQLYNEKPCEDTSNFKTVLWKGNNTTGHFINNVGMDLETNGGLVWIKSRNDVDNHIWQDNVRGITNYIMSSSTLQQFNSDMVVSLEKTGFVLGADTPTGVNTNNIDFVSWVWKGGGDAVSNTDGVTSGSVTAVTSTVSANQDAGFSINKFTTPSSGFPSWGHGLSESPELIILKATGLTQNWIVYAPSILGQKDGNLNTSDDFTSYSPDIISVDSSKIDLGRSGYGLSGSSDYIAYCFHSVSGISSIGSYEGNGTTDNKITTGFQPNFVMLKNVDRDNTRWIIMDTARDPENTAYKVLSPNLLNAEDTSTSYWLLDWESDGFRLKYGADNEFNKSGDTFIYMAFK